MQSRSAMPVPRDLKTGSSWLPARRESNSPESSLRYYTLITWMDHMVRTDFSLAERMTFFHHTHFTTMQSRANYGSAVYYQIELFRHYALGNFRELATKICYDQAMLMHLDGRYNKKTNPNENFAREFLELYSIGKGGGGGHYTEGDIKQATRIFSGFYIDETFAQNIDPDTQLPIARMLQKDNGEPTLHDFEPKTFSEKFDNTTITPEGKTVPAVYREIEEFVDMVFAQPETARHICRKLYRFFVYHEITDQVERNFIQPLAKLFQEEDYELRPVLEAMFTSQHFYDIDLSDKQRQIRGAQIKSPLELVVGTLRYFRIKLPNASSLDTYYALYNELMWTCEQQGMKLYQPAEVAGYTAYHQAPAYDQTWISANTMGHRHKFIDRLLRGKLETRDLEHTVQFKVMDYVNRYVSDPGDAERTVRELLEDVIPQPVGEERFAYFLNEVLLDSLEPEAWRTEWQEYRSGKSTSITQQFEKLFSFVLNSPEYQLN